MRALLDTNLFISYLLSPRPLTSAMGAILAAAAEERFVLLFTPGIAEEINEKVAERPDLAARITAGDITNLLDNLDEIADMVPRLSGPFPAVCRDVKDDYLIAHALGGNADFLVSWDFDLRDLGQFGRLGIVSPPDFLQALRSAGVL